jgi:hypothetical protein
MSTLACTARSAAIDRTVPAGSVIRCVSIAVASLSLSLSLSWPGLLASRPFRRPGWAASLGRVGRVGFSRACRSAVGARLSLLSWRGACPSVIEEGMCC